VPEDLAIVGFDNIPEAAFLIPPLSTIYQNVIDMGGFSVRRLHEMITAPDEHSESRVPVSTLLKPELLIRASSHSVTQ
jgi:DNA-binding LacI/PurR family transcriptional regulator